MIEQFSHFKVSEARESDAFLFTCDRCAACGTLVRVGNTMVVRDRNRSGSLIVSLASAGLTAWHEEVPPKALIVNDYAMCESCVDLEGQLVDFEQALPDVPPPPDYGSVLNQLEELADARGRATRTNLEQALRHAKTLIRLLEEELLP